MDPSLVWYWADPIDVFFSRGISVVAASEPLPSASVCWYVQECSVIIVSIIYRHHTVIVLLSQ